MSRLSDLQTFYADIAERHLRRIGDAVNDISSRSYTPTNLISDSLATTLDVLAAFRYPLDLLRPVPPTVRFRIQQTATDAVESISLNDPKDTLVPGGLVSVTGNAIQASKVKAAMDANKDNLIVRLENLANPQVDSYTGTIRGQSTGRIIAVVEVVVST